MSGVEHLLDTKIVIGLLKGYQKLTGEGGTPAYHLA